LLHSCSSCFLLVVYSSCVSCFIFELVKSPPR
jgi:hypothetical protein